MPDTTGTPAAPAATLTADQLRAAVEAHRPEHGSTQWYVDEHTIDCDADEFWAVIAAALTKE